MSDNSMHHFKPNLFTTLKHAGIESIQEQLQGVGRSNRA